MLQSTLKLAAKNMPIFPVHGIVDGRCSCQRSNCSSPGKHPIPYNGLKSATSNHAQVRQWWTQNPSANIGLVTGKVSGLVVVDIDPRNGGDESFFDLEKQYGPFPRTKEVLTGGGGQHLYFRYPSVGMACKSGKTGLFRGIDIKGDGGYVLVPPSLHVSGKHYEWEVASYEQELAELPEWFLNLLLGCGLPSSDKHGKCVNGDRVEYRARHTEWSGFLKQPFPEGQRNTSLTQIAGYFLAKRIDGYLALDICHSINQTVCKPPLPEQEVIRIVNSIARQESQKMMEAHYG